MTSPGVQPLSLLPHPSLPLHAAVQTFPTPPHSPLEPPATFANVAATSLCAQTLGVPMHPPEMSPDAVQILLLYKSAWI